MIFAVLTFTICFAVIYSAYWAFILRPEEEAVGVVRRRLKKEHVRQVARSELLRQVRAMSSIGAVDALLKRAQSRTERLQLLIDQAGLKISVGTLIAGSATLGALAFYIVLRFGLWISLAIGAGVLVERVCELRKAERRPRLVDGRQAAVEHPPEHRGHDGITKPAHGPGGRQRPAANHRPSLRRERVEVRHQHGQRQARLLGCDHRANQHHVRRDNVRLDALDQLQRFAREDMIVFGVIACVGQQSIDGQALRRAWQYIGTARPRRHFTRQLLV